MKDRLRAFVVLIAVFLLGGLLGAAGSYFWLDRYSASKNEDREYGPPPPHGRPQLPELLEMTPAQEARFGEIMKESRWQLDALQMEQRPKIDAVVDETNKKIYSILDARQKKKLDEFLVEIKTWRSRGHGDRGFDPLRRGDRKTSSFRREDYGKGKDAPGGMRGRDGRPPEGIDPFR